MRTSHSTSLAALAAAVLVMTTPPASAARRLQDGQAEARERVAAASAELEGSTRAVRAALAALRAAEAELPAARAEAAEAQGRLDGALARAATAERAASLGRARASQARSAVRAANRSLDDERVAVGQMARRTYQRGPLADVGALLQAGSPQDVLDRRELLSQAFRAQNDSLRRLSRERLRLARASSDLAAEEARLDDLQQESERVRDRARASAVSAQAAAARVDSLVRQRASGLAAAEQARAGDALAYQEAQRASRAVAERIRRAAAAARAQERARARARARALAEAAAAQGPGRPARPDPRPADGPKQDGRWLWPADGPLTSRYGMRRHPLYGDERLHAGIDIGAPAGSQTRAGDDGVVTYAGPASGYGTLVLISHGTVDGVDITSSYAHQSRLLVQEGQRVRRGEPVGVVGSEGNVTGPHLHFEVRRDGEPTDPLDWVTPP